MLSWRGEVRFVHGWETKTDPSYRKKRLFFSKKKDLSILSSSSSFLVLYIVVESVDKWISAVSSYRGGL